jgi:hypothetical protein
MMKIIVIFNDVSGLVDNTSERVFVHAPRRRERTFIFLKYERSIGQLVNWSVTQVSDKRRFLNTGLFNP